MERVRMCQDLRTYIILIKGNEFIEWPWCAIRMEHINKSWLKEHLWLKLARYLIWISASVISNWSWLVPFLSSLPWFHWLPGDIHNYYIHEFSFIYQFRDNFTSNYLLRENVHMLLTLHLCWNLSDPHCSILKYVSFCKYYPI